VKIQSTESLYYLNSEQKNLNSGSGQQLITFVKDAATPNTLWWIRPANHKGDVEYPSEGDGSTCQQGKPIVCGTIIRLTHVDTLRNLHSHGVKSVLSQQQEVTGFGTGDGKGDGGDNWKVVCTDNNDNSSNGGGYWTRGTTFHLHHQDTNKFLGTARNLKFDAQTCGHNCPIMGHLEAFCRSAQDGYSVMRVDQGVHISK
jgi:dolichyl-phosphate-mannose--protein O-mannosyl transferase